MTPQKPRRVVVTRSKTERKSRRIVVTLEADTDMPLDGLTDHGRWQHTLDDAKALQESRERRDGIPVRTYAFTVIQASANVIRAGKKGGRR